MNFIEVKNLSKVYIYQNEPVIALNDVSFNLPSKGLVVVLGKSGSGKSTLINLLFGIDKSYSGEIYLNGIELNDFNNEKINEFRHNNVSFIYQDLKLMDNFSVLDNIILSYTGNKNEALQKIDRMLELLEIKKLKHKKVKKLSGGERQRVAICKGLISDTPIICLDEPTSNLDYNSTLIIKNTLKEIAKEKLILVITHDSIFNDEPNKLILDSGKLISNSINDFNNTFTEHKKDKNINVFKTFFKLSFFNIILNVFIVAIISAFIIFLTKPILEKTTIFNKMNNIENRYIIKKHNDYIFEDLEIDKLLKNSNYIYYTFGDTLDDERVSTITIANRYQLTTKFNLSNNLKKNEVVLNLPISYKKLVNKNYSNISLIFNVRLENNKSYFEIKNVNYFIGNETPTMTLSYEGFEIVDTYCFNYENDLRMEFKDTNGYIRFDDSLEDNVIVSENQSETVSIDFYESNQVVETKTIKNIYKQQEIIDKVVMNTNTYINLLKDYKSKNVRTLNIITDDSSFQDKYKTDFSILNCNYENVYLDNVICLQFKMTSLASFLVIFICIVTAIILYFLIYLQIRKYRILYSSGYSRKTINKAFLIQFLIYYFVSIISGFIMYYYMHFIKLPELKINGFMRFEPIYNYIIFYIIIFIMFYILKKYCSRKIKIKGIDEF